MLLVRSGKSFKSRIVPRETKKSMPGHTYHPGLDPGKRVSQKECYYSVHALLHSRFSVALWRKKHII